MMEMSFVLKRYVEAIHWLQMYEAPTVQQNEAEARLNRCTIALSREAGVPAEEVSREVSARLDWPVYDHELLERIANEMHCPVDALERLDERHQSWLLECLEGFGGVPGLNQSRYVHRLIQVIRSLGEQGCCLIVGRGASFILPAQSTLRVHLVGNTEDRIAALGRRLHVGRNKAERCLAEINREYSRFIWDFFHADPAQPRNYDLVLNTSQWTAAECANLVLQALQRKPRASIQMDFLYSSRRP